VISLRNGRWSIRCGGCLKSLDDFIGTRDAAVAHITGAPHWWEMQTNDMCRCLACSRKARDVTQYDQRGREVRSRRR
jgi:hypothetical protein